MKTTLIKNLKKSLFLLSAAVILFTGCKAGAGDDSSPDGSYSFADAGPFVPGNTSIEMAKNMAIGWNLGNAFDASGCSTYDYTNATNGTLEYSWLPQGSASKTSQELIKAVKAAGFKTIRIPVSWHNYMDKKDSTYTINSTYMARVKEVVDWALAEKMCVIINIHHDNLSVTAEGDEKITETWLAENTNNTDNDIASNPGFALSKDAAVQAKSKAYIKAVWTQIAKTFKDYDNSLVFELLNEPRCIGTEVEWGFYGSNASKAKTYCDIITDYEQAALDVIRASGGNNATRYISAPSYAASPDYLSSYTLPTDTTANRLLLAVHAYTPGDFALAGESTDFDAYRNPYGSNSTAQEEIDYVFNGLKTGYIDKGIGVVMGEASASDKNNLSSRLKWAKYYFEKATSVGIPVVLWDNEQVAKNSSDKGGENHGYFNRKTCKQTNPEMIEAMMKAVYGTSTSGTAGSGDDGDGVTEIVILDASKLASAPTLNAQEDKTILGSIELTEIDGVKYIKVTPDGYKTSFGISNVDISNFNKIVVTMKSDADTEGVQGVVKTMDSSWKSVCAENNDPAMNPLSATAKAYEKQIAPNGDYIAAVIQPMVQNTSDWSARSDTAIYISKIIAKK